MLVSSAASVNDSLPDAELMSLISIQNRKGPETESWGTPHLMLNNSKLVPLVNILLVRVF